MSAGLPAQPQVHTPCGGVHAARTPGHAPARDRPRTSQVPREKIWGLKESLLFVVLQIKL
jgi:hypothetical protein